MAELPHFSIVICNYNYAAFVVQAARSALDQDYPADRVQVVVVDDGSTDGSRAVLGQFSDDPRFDLVLQENRGQSAAFEAGVHAATGEYICLLDSDDLFEPHKLARVAARIAELGEPADNLFLCHDLLVRNSATGAPIGQSWFDIVGIKHLPDRFTVQAPVQSFPFSIPAGLVFSRRLIARVLDALPCWAFPRGADGVLCPAVFLQTGCVHYLREQLGVYRIHGDNEFASVVDGRFTPRFNPSSRLPKTLQFLEQWIDMLDQPAPQRAVALDYLRRFEHQGRRLSHSRRLTEPGVSVLLAGQADSASVTANLQSHASVSFHTPGAPEDPQLAWMARGYLASDDEYIVFLRAGDRLDRGFVERHLFCRQHAALVGVSCSDVRLSSAQGSLVHADVMRNSGAWKQPLQQVPPLATLLRDWVAPPMSACLFRRSAFLDRLFARAAEVPAELQEAGFWLVFQLQHHTSGVLRIMETLGTCRLPDGAAASYGYLSAASGSNGMLIHPPLAAAVAWLGQFYEDERPLFEQWLPPAWHQRFGAWLAAQGGNGIRAP